MYGKIIYGNIFALSVATFFDTIDRTFFTPNFGTYEKLKYFNDPMAFKLTVIGIYIGVIIASLCMYYNRHVLGALVRKLDADGCDSPENAKTLEALGFGKNIFVKIRHFFNTHKIQEKLVINKSYCFSCRFFL